MSDIQIWKHVKTGGLYELREEDCPATLKANLLEPMTIYRSLKDGRIWIRPSSEFYDGRFERAADPPTPEQGGDTSRRLGPKLTAALDEVSSLPGSEGLYTEEMVECLVVAAGDDWCRAVAEDRLHMSIANGDLDRTMKALRDAEARIAGALAVLGNVEHRAVDTISEALAILSGTDPAPAERAEDKMGVTIENCRFGHFEIVFPGEPALDKAQTDAEKIAMVDDAIAKAKERAGIIPMEKVDVGQSPNVDVYMATIPVEAAPSPDVGEALASAESWIDRHTAHAGSCLGGSVCTCGRTAVLHELREALASLRTDPAGRKGDG